MTGVLLSPSFLTYASYHPRPPANNTGWDVLYVAIGSVVILLAVALAATLANHRDDRRHARPR